jgi:quercetin dioxygenase-like cupin family protein
MAQSVFFHDKIEKIDMGKGVIRQDFANGKNMNVLHWNMSDKSVVGMHTHPQEQFGYCIKGGFELTIGDEVFHLKAGDAYLVPANVPHAFVAVGETEAIDVFSPIKTEFPWDKK